MAKQAIFILKNFDRYFDIYNLAVKHGKKPGESMQAEFEEIYKQHPEDFEPIGTTEDDVDIITGELRDRGVKTFNIHEIDRKKEQNSKDKI